MIKAELTQDVLQEMWYGSNAKIEKVYSEGYNSDTDDYELVNFGNAEVKKVDGGWLYVDDQDGFELLTQDEYELLDNVR